MSLALPGPDFYDVAVPTLWNDEFYRELLVADAYEKLDPWDADKCSSPRNGIRRVV